MCYLLLAILGVYTGLNVINNPCECQEESSFKVSQREHRNILKCTSTGTQVAYIIGSYPHEGWAVRHRRQTIQPACPQCKWDANTLFFETKCILIENKIQNNSFQKTEIFHPFPTNQNLLYPQSISFMCERACVPTISPSVHWAALSTQEVGVGGLRRKRRGKSHTSE